MRGPDSSTGFRYGVAVLAVVAALAVRLAFDPLLGLRQEFLLFSVSVLVAARFGGRGPGLAAAGLSVPLAWFFFVEPRNPLALANLRDAASLVFLAAASIAISLLGSRAHATFHPGPSDPHQTFHAPFLRRAVLLGAALVVLMVLTQLLYGDFERDKRRHYWITRAYQALNQVQVLISNLEQTESARRGYLLTGNEDYLGAFQTALLAVHSVRSDLGRLTADNPGQQARLNALDRLVDARLAVLQRNIDIRRHVGPGAAAAQVRTGEGARIMDQCRILLRAVEEEEQGLLAKRSTEAEALALRTRWVLGLGSGSLLMLLVIAITVIERDIWHRERDRQAVRKSEQRLRLALDAANAGIWEWDLRTNRIVWSEELWKVYGLEPHSCQPSHEAWLQLMHPDDRAKADQVTAQAARAGAALNVEFRVRGRDGSLRWLLARGQPLRDAQGQTECFAGIALDITLRKQAEEALREREQNLRRFTEAAPVAIAMFDREMRYLAASQRFRDDFHLGAQELVGRCHYEIFPEIPEHWRAIHRRCLAGAVDRHPGERFVRSDGSEQWIRWEIQPWRQANGEVGGIVMFTEEITSQRRSEQALQASEARLRLAQQVARIGTFEWNIQTGENTWTAELEAMYGLQPGGFARTHEAWESLIHPEDRPEVVRQVGQALETAKFEAEWRVIWPDGTVRWLAGRSWVFKDENGNPLRMIGVDIDVTEAKQAEQALRRTQAELREAQRVAHLSSWRWDLRTDAISCSEELYKIFGLDPQQPFPAIRDQSRLYTAESWRLLEAARNAALETGAGYELDLELVRADGAGVWVATLGEAVRDPSGRIEGLHCTVQDITRRKRAEDEILARNAVLDAIGQVFREALSCQSLASLGAACQSTAQALTGSRSGCIGMIDAASGRLDCISTSDPGWAGGSSIHRLYERLLLEEKGLDTTDPSSPAVGPGLLPDQPLLGVPLVHAGKTVGLIAMGNREAGYGPREREALEALAPAIVQVFMSRRAEHAQRESEAQFRTLADAIPQLCWMANADGGIFWYNQRWYEYTGTTPEQMAGWGWQSVHDPAALPQVLDRWKASLASGEPLDMVFPLRSAAGAFHPFLTRVMPVRDRDGKVVRWFGTNTDITDQYRTEAALRQVSEQQRLAMEAADLGAWDYRFQTGDVYWDERCRNMFGFAAGGRNQYDEAMTRIHTEDRPGAHEAVQQAIAGAGAGAYHREFRVVWPDGSVHWIASHGRAHADEENPSGPPVRFTGVNMDITERKRAELEIRLLNTQLEQRVRQRTAELETANRELEAFSYSVSHDLRAPLRGIDGWSLALAEDYAGQLDGRAQRYLDRVRSETQRMGLLIDDMLQLSRVSRSAMEFAPVDLTGLAQRIAARLAEAHSARSIEFVIQPGLAAPGDVRLIEIALDNLLANAVKFTGPRPKARVEFGMTKHRADPVFWVRDNGVGFDMTYAGALFGAFQRLHKTSQFPGTGIGLAIVQRVIHRHGGRVWAEAQPDRGATFHFTIGTTA